MSFLEHLSATDLNRLRTIIKRVHMANFPESHVTNYEADRIIEAFGPDVADRELRKHFKGMGFEPANLSTTTRSTPKPEKQRVISNLRPRSQKRDAISLPDGYKIRITTADGETTRTELVDPGRPD